jgi:hypothetical protein
MGNIIAVVAVLLIHIDIPAETPPHHRQDCREPVSRGRERQRRQQQHQQDQRAGEQPHGSAAPVEHLLGGRVRFGGLGRFVVLAQQDH